MAVTPSRTTHGIGLPIEAVRGHQMSRNKVREQLLTWEKRHRLVETQMAGKGFTHLQVRAALAECEKMIDFYDELLEKME